MMLTILLITLLCATVVAISARQPRLGYNLDRDIQGQLPSGPLNVLILTAGVGGGHNAAGRALEDELTQAGHHVTMIDGIRAMSPVLAWLLVQGYVQPLRFAPWLLRPVFGVASHRWGARVIQGLVSATFGGRLQRTIQAHNPDVVFSTFPLITGVLGRLRSRGELTVPTLAAIADYGAHALWVAPGIDLHLVMSEQSADIVRQAGGMAAPMRLPVASSFRISYQRDAMRAALNIPGDAFVVLIIGGALGIGDVEGATVEALAAGAFPLVVTGRNEHLRARLEHRFGQRDEIRILGWRSDVATLMGAADCLLQNAGGMTCLEAIEMELPIVMYQPIPGHGKFNAQVMEQTGAATWPRSSSELRQLFAAAARHERPLRVPAYAVNQPSIHTVLAALPTFVHDAALRAPQPRRSWQQISVVGLLTALGMVRTSGEPLMALAEVDAGVDRVVRKFRDAQLSRRIDDQFKQQWTRWSQSVGVRARDER